MKPARIRNELMNSGQIVPIRTVQKFSYNLKNYTLAESDYVVDVAKLVQEYTLENTVDEESPFFLETNMASMDASKSRKTLLRIP